METKPLMETIEVFPMDQVPLHLDPELSLDIQPLEVEVETEKNKYNFSSALKYRWKGKVVSEKFYNRKLKQAAAKIVRRSQSDVKIEGSDYSNEQNDSHNQQEVEFPVKGERTVDLEFMAKIMKCTECQGGLLLENIQKEIRRRSRSILHIECHGCRVINKIPTKG